MIDTNDISTIISIYPIGFREMKPGLNPNFFEIPPAKDMDNPVFVHIPQATHNVYLGEMRSFPVENPSFVVAKAIVDDIVNAMVEVSPNARPGLRVLPGKFDRAVVGAEIKDMKVLHINWFRKLVELADNLWQNTRDTRNVSEIQRIAAKTLNLDREWLIVHKAIVPVKCPACTSLISSEALICPNCRTIIDPVEYNKRFRSIKVG